MPRPGPSTVNVDWDADDIPLRYRARDGRIDTTHSENGSVLASVPLPTRQQTRLDLARLIATEGWTVVPSESATSAAAMQEDLRAILDALGLGDHARPYSAHECVTRDVLPAIERLRQPDRPEPVDPSSVRVGDIVEIEANDGLWMVRGYVIDVEPDNVPRRLSLHPDRWLPDLTTATVRVLHRAEPEPDEAAVEAWRDWLRGKGCADETYCPDVIARELARADVTAPEVNRDE